MLNGSCVAVQTDAGGCVCDELDGLGDRSAGPTSSSGRGLRPCLVPNKSPTYKLKSRKSDLFCQTPPTYKSPLLISFKLVHPYLRACLF